MKTEKDDDVDADVALPTHIPSCVFRHYARKYLQADVSSFDGFLLVASSIPLLEFRHYVTSKWYILSTKFSPLCKYRYNETVPSYFNLCN
jgi:hypothetical protein